MKIGVIADTHVPKAMPALPGRVREALRGADIILHVGDICNLATLQELEELTITMAVSGNRDDERVRKYVEPSRVVEFANRRIGMIHGHRGLLPELADAARAKLMGRPQDEGLYPYLLSQFPDVDCILFGHTHRPYAKVHRGILLFNPGSPAPGRSARPSVGLLNVSAKSISGRIIYLN